MKPGAIRFLVPLLVTCFAVLASEAAAKGGRVKPAKVEPGPLAPLKRSEGPGQITYVTSDAVFVDRGSLDGVAVGAALAVSRAGKAVGTCAVATVTEHGATCTGAGFQQGDRISTVRKASPPPTLPALPDAKELAARLAAVEESPPPVVDFEGGGVAMGPSTGHRLSVVLSQTTFSNFVSRSGPYQLQRLDAQLHDFRIWRGLRASADVSVLNWSRRPEGFGNPDTRSTQVFVRQLEVDWREAGGRFDLAAGRLWLKHVPGLAMVDGVQAGLHTASGSLEGGVFGGLMPNSLSLAPSLSQWTAGAYATARLFSGEGADAFWIEPEVRANWAVLDTVGGRFEVGAALHAWFGKLVDGHALAQLGFASATAAGFVDFMRVDLGLHPSERFQVQLGARYRGNPYGTLVELGAPTPGARGINADAALLLTLSALTVGLNAMVANDLDSQLMQTSAGVQVQFPTLLGRIGAVGLGFNEELGWLPGRSAWAQLMLSPHWRVRALARLSWFMQDASASANGVAGHELGASLSLDVRLTAWLWVRLSALGRQALSAPLPSETDLSGLNPFRAGVTANAALGVDL
jgi:hypothetical protein